MSATLNVPLGEVQAMDVHSLSLVLRLLGKARQYKVPVRLG